MIATFVMNWSWMELPVDGWTDLVKLEWRYTPNDQIENWYSLLYDWICITADTDNAWPVLISDYEESKQVNDGTRADFIELIPWWEIHLPRNTKMSALNKPYVMWASGDVLKVIAR